MAPGTVLTGNGSTNANLLGLYYYTTRSDQTLQGDAMVDIGLHYVAASSNSANGWVPLATNGIPDYVADVNGNGQIPLGATDPNSTFYSNIDLDGDGMVGSVETALGTDPLAFDNPLILGQIDAGLSTTGCFTFVVSNTLIESKGQLTLMVDGITATTSTQTNQNGPLLVWNANCYSVGNHYLQAHLVLNGSGVSADGPLVAFSLPAFSSSQSARPTAQEALPRFWLSLLVGHVPINGTMKQIPLVVQQTALIQSPTLRRMTMVITVLP